MNKLRKLLKEHTYLKSASFIEATNQNYHKVRRFSIAETSTIDNIDAFNELCEAIAKAVELYNNKISKYETV